MTMSAASTSSMEFSGVMRHPGIGAAHGAAVMDAVVTRKRGSGLSPFSSRHSAPAEWNTSIGMSAVDA